MNHSSQHGWMADTVSSEKTHRYSQVLRFLQLDFKLHTSICRRHVAVTHKLVEEWTAGEHTCNLPGIRASGSPSRMWASWHICVSYVPNITTIWSTGTDIRDQPSRCSFHHFKTTFYLKESLTAIYCSLPKHWVGSYFRSQNRMGRKILQTPEECGVLTEGSKLTGL